MGAAGNGLVAAWWARFNDPALVVLVGVGLLVVIALLFSVLLLSRRRFQSDLREVVRVLEEMRTGEIPDRKTVDSGSPMALVFDSINRLGQDLGARVRSLEETSGRMRTMMEAVGENVVITTDTDGDVRSFSRGAEELFGWQETEVLSHAASVLFDEDSYKDFLPKLARRTLREKGIDTRAIMQRRDGAKFPAEVSVRVLRGGGGAGAGFLLRVKDVSQTVRLERQLREAEERYRSLVEGLVDGALIVRRGRVLYANPAFARMCGTTAKQTIEMPLRDRIATRDLLMVEEQLSTVEAGKQEAVELSCGLLGADGAPGADVSIKAAAVAHGESRAVLLLVRDVTQERRVEAELRRNEARLDAVLEAASDAILVLVESAGEQFVQLINDAFAKLFGIRSERLLGIGEKRLLELLRSRPGYGPEVARFLASGGSGARRELLAGRAGEPGDLQVTLAPLSDAEGRPLGRVLACRDLREQRESERKLQQHAEQLQLSKVMLEQAFHRLETLNADLENRTEQLDKLNRELRKLDDMKSNLLGNVSHELQTPLVSIRGYTEMMLKERLGAITEEQRKGLGLCLRNVDRLISMIDNLLVFGRSDSELAGLELERFSLRALVDESAELLAEKLAERKIRLSVNLEGGDLEIHADRGKVQQVLVNLLSNAVKFNHEGGRVSVRARSGRSGFAQVEVEDSGIGIPPDSVHRVFERHYQVPRKAGESPQGSGIGLAIVKEILLSHGCRIDVDSREGQGSRFRFTLPLAGAEADAARGPEPEPEPESPPPEKKPPRLRIIRRER